MKRSPLRAKRDRPRRNEGRVTHGRMKPKPGKTAEHEAHMDRVASLGCLVCGAPATVHHVTSDGYQRCARSHERVAPLCPKHHMIQWGPHESVEALGHAGFRDRYGIDLMVWALDAWRYRAEPEHPFWTVGVTRNREVARLMDRVHRERAGSAQGRTKALNPL